MMIFSNLFITDFYLRFTACRDLVMSRFCPVDFKQYGVVGMKVCRVHRIHNRFLHFRFDRKLSHVVEGTVGEFYPGKVYVWMSIGDIHSLL